LFFFKDFSRKSPGQGDCFLINGTQAIFMSAEGSKIYFKKHHKMQPVLFVIYADFEAIRSRKR